MSSADEPGLRRAWIPDSQPCFISPKHSEPYLESQKLEMALHSFFSFSLPDVGSNADQQPHPGGAPTPQAPQNALWPSISALQ